MPGALPGRLSSGRLPGAREFRLACRLNAVAVEQPVEVLDKAAMVEHLGAGDGLVTVEGLLGLLVVLEALIADFVGQEQGTVRIASGQVWVGEVRVDNGAFQVEDQVVRGCGQGIRQLLATVEKGPPRGLSLVGKGRG